jgi:hypothetical protein
MKDEGSFIYDPQNKVSFYAANRAGAPLFNGFHPSSFRLHPSTPCEASTSPHRARGVALGEIL